jgi:hypothetical protein
VACGGSLPFLRFFIKSAFIRSLALVDLCATLATQKGGAATIMPNLTHLNAFYEEVYNHANG